MKFIKVVKKIIVEQDEKDVVADLLGVTALFVILFITLIPGGPG